VAEASQMAAAEAAAKALLAEYDGYVEQGLYPRVAGIQRRCIEDQLKLAWLQGVQYAVSRVLVEQQS
jgi:hypothetical protein